MSNEPFLEIFVEILPKDLCFFAGKRIGFAIQLFGCTFLERNGHVFLPTGREPLCSFLGKDLVMSLVFGRDVCFFQMGFVSIGLGRPLLCKMSPSHRQGSEEIPVVK